VVSAELQVAWEPLLRAIESLSEQILAHNECIEQMARESHPAVERLKQVKGVGTLIALACVLTLEDPGPFAISPKAGCYVGLQPGRRNCAAVRRSCTSARWEIPTYEPCWCRERNTSWDRLEKIVTCESGDYLNRSISLGI
jgi:transposase